MCTKDKSIRKEIVVEVVKSVAGIAIDTFLPAIISNPTKNLLEILAPSNQELKDRFIQQMNERLALLEHRDGIDLSALSSNSQFTDAVRQAMYLATKTSEQAKLNAFKNDISNIAVGISIDHTKCQIFLQYIDQFTTLHIKLLSYYKNPRKWLMDLNMPTERRKGKTLDLLLKEALIELRDQDDLINLLWTDVQRLQMVRGNGPREHVFHGSHLDLLPDKLTALGEEFLAFICYEEKHSNS